MLIVAKLFMNNFFFKVLIFLSEYPFRLVRFEISTRTENRTVLSRNIGTKRNGDFFLWIWDRILNFKIPNIWNGSGYLQIPDPPVPCTPLVIVAWYEYYDHNIDPFIYRGGGGGEGSPSLLLEIPLHKIMVSVASTPFFQRGDYGGFFDI